MPTRSGASGKAKPRDGQHPPVRSPLLEPLEARLLLSSTQFAPVLVDVSPAANSHTAPAGTNVSATYDEDVDPASASDQTFVVHARQTGRLLAPLNAVGVSGPTVTLSPALPFHPGEWVQVTATTGIEDLGGQGPASPFVWQFRVASAAGDASFTENGQVLGASTSRDAALGDLDGDGDLDAFVANCAQPDRVWLNDGQGQFFDSGQALGSTCSARPALGDLDGDGDLDAFVANASNQPNRVWLNDGQGQFLDTGQALGGSGSTVALGDLDGDGDLDAFVANGPDQPNKVWLNDGHGTFTDSGQRLGDSFGSDLALGDLDGDGDLDAFVANRHGANKVWLNDGAGTFSDSGQAMGDADSQGSSLGDLDGDGDLDAFIANTSGEANEVWLNDGQGTFTDSGQRLGNSWSPEACLGDLDCDGDLDAFVVNWGRQPNKVWLNDAHGTFSDSGQSLGAAVGSGGCLGDLDGNGSLDAFVANGQRQANRVWLNAVVRGSISGTKWYDRDRDGFRDGEEPPLPGRKVYVDANANGTCEPDEPFAVTEADGTYLIEGVLPGAHVVAEELEPGWEQTYPRSVVCFSDFETDDGGWQATATWDPVGDWQRGAPTSGPGAAHSGQNVWATRLDANYTNADGSSYLSQTFDLTGLAGVELSFRHWARVFRPWDTAKISVNGDVVHERATAGTTSGYRQMVFDLSAYDGLSSVTIVFELYATDKTNVAGWYVDDVTLASTRHKVLVASGATTEEVDFGNYAPGEIRGGKFHDADGDGVWDQGGPTTQDFEELTVSGPPLDQVFSGSGTGVYENSAAGEGVRLVTEAGNTFLRLTRQVTYQCSAVAFDGTAEGTYEMIAAEFDFRLSEDHGYSSDGIGFALLDTATYGATGPGPMFFSLDEADMVPEMNLPDVFGVGFDLWKNDGGFDPNDNHLSLHFDGNLIGVADPGFPLDNGGWHHARIAIEYVTGGAEVSVVLTEDGGGRHVLRFEGSPTVFIPGMAPFESRAAFAARTGGLPVADQDIDNVEIAYFRDELPLPGRTVYLDLNDNGRLDDSPYEPRAVTDALGGYCLSSPAAGPHTVAEVPHSGCIQTSPAGRLVAVDFDQPGGTSPAHWTQYTGGAGASFTDLVDETGTPTPFDLALATTGAVMSASACAPDPATLPTHAQPLDGLSGYVYEAGEATWTFEWSDLTPLAEYGVYVFGLKGAGGANHVTIRGAEGPVAFDQVLAGGQLVVGSETGDPLRGLISFAKLVAADAAGRIIIEVTPGTEAGLALGGLAIQPAAGNAHTLALELGQIIEGVDFGDLDVEPPSIADVLVAGAGWSQEFLDFLAAGGLGEGGCSIPAGSPDQLDELPWANLDQVKIVFSEDVNVAQSHLALYGVNVPQYALDGFAYDAQTLTATWTLDVPVPADKLLLLLSDAVTDAAGKALDGDWANAGSGYPSGDGRAGGDFLLRLNALPGDMNRDGSVDWVEYVTLKRNFGSSSGATWASGDVDGDCDVDYRDYTAARQCYGTSLPGGEPSSPVPPGTAAPAADAPPETTDPQLLTCLAAEPAQSAGLEPAPATTEDPARIAEPPLAGAPLRPPTAPRAAAAGPLMVTSTDRVVYERRQTKPSPALLAADLLRALPVPRLDPFARR